MDSTHIRLPPTVLVRADSIRARLAGAPTTAAIGRQLNRSSILRAALDRGLDELEKTLEASETGLPT